MKAVFHTCILASGYLLAQCPAYGQEDPAGVVAAAEGRDSAGDGSQLSDIVVTAQRRDESVQKVPIAVTVLNSEALTSFGISNPDALTHAVPGFSLPRIAGSSLPFIRGVGTNGGTIGNEPSVAVFVDDVYVVTGAASIFEFNNIDSIEVVKGPQGTLFGRNATGGVVQIKTRQPSYDTQASASIGYANYDTVTGQAYVSTGLTDRLAFNIAAFFVDQRDGWGTNIVTGNELFRRKSYGVRGKLLLEPTPETTILLSGSYVYEKSDQGIASRTVPGDFGRNGYSPEALGLGFYDGAVNQDGSYRPQFQQYSAKITHDMDAASVVSISSYSHFKSPFSFDLDASPTPFFQVPAVNQLVRTYTQEVQLLSPRTSDVQWIIGAFYLHDEAILGNRFIIAGGGSNSDTRQNTDSISAFAQATMEILPRLKMTTGLRFTSDHREVSGISYDGQPLANPAVPATIVSYPPSMKKTFSNLTGRFALAYEASENLNIYAAYNRGFKSGIFLISSQGPSSPTFPAPVFPEELNAYTAGFKSELFDRKLRLNVEAYYYDYKNIQVQNNIATGSIITNGGGATIKGVDVELTARPTANLMLSATLAYADGKYDTFDNGPQFFPQAPNAPIPIPSGCPFTAYPTGPGPTVQALGCSLAGNKTIQTVPLSTNLGFTYTIPTPIGSFDLVGSWSYGGRQYFEPDNNAATRQPRTNLVNASVGWANMAENFSARLWVRNLTSEKYYANVGQSTTSGVKFAPAAPRTYGITLSADF